MRKLAFYVEKVARMARSQRVVNLHLHGFSSFLFRNVGEHLRKRQVLNTLNVVRECSFSIWG